MEAKIIFRAGTDDLDQIRDLQSKINYGEAVIIPEDMKILIKEKDGFWREAK